MVIIENNLFCPIRIYYKFYKANRIIGLYDKLKKSYSKIITDDELREIIYIEEKNSPIDIDSYIIHSIAEKHLIEFLDKKKGLCDFTFRLNFDFDL